MCKVVVAVEAYFDAEGRITPRAIQWEDGRRFEIDKVLDVRTAASMKAGGNGTRYTCRIMGRVRYLWFENPMWFVEGR